MLWWSGDAAGATQALTVTLAGDVSPAVRLDLTNTLSRKKAVVGDTDGALELEVELARLARAAGHLPLALLSEMNSACSLRELGRPDEALVAMENAIPAFLIESPLPRLLPVAAEDYAAILVEVGRAADAARLWGAPGDRERYDWRRRVRRPRRSPRCTNGARGARRRVGRAGCARRTDDLEETLRAAARGGTSLTG